MHSNEQMWHFKISLQMHLKVKGSACG